MRTIELPWESWRAVITALRTKGLPYLLEHADHLERQLDQYPPDAVVRLSHNDDVDLRSDTWARWQMGIPLPEEG